MTPLRKLAPLFAAVSFVLSGCAGDDTPESGRTASAGEGSDAGGCTMGGESSGGGGGGGC